MITHKEKRMTDIMQWFKDMSIEWWDFFDILIVAFLIYQLIKLTKQTRAYQVLKGFAVIIIVSQIAQWFELSTLAWVSNYVLEAGAIVLVILFQPELRRALEKIGRGKLLTINQNDAEEEDSGSAIAEIVRAVQRMSGQRVGALIVVQGREPLGDIIESGTTLYARVSAPLLENIFTPNTPLHDGAVIVQDKVLIAAGCFLPMTNNPDLAQEVGTRHRAAIGMSENTDAAVIVVSEETGVVSCARGGKLTRYLDGNSLQTILSEIIVEEPKKSGWLRSLMNRRSRGNE